MDKHVFHQHANCYKGQELMTEDEEDAHSTRYVKACLGRLYQHEIEALKQKTELTSLDLYAIKRFHRLKVHCSGLEPDEKPLTDEVHHEVVCCYETLNHTLFTIQTPFNMVCLWKREFNVVSNLKFCFVVCLPHSKFIFTHHVQTIIEKVNSDVEDATNKRFLAIEVYDPPPSKEYV